VIDPHREYGDLPGVMEVDSLEALSDYLRFCNGRWRISYHNQHLNDEFEQLCAAARRLKDCLLIVEETDWFCNAHKMPLEFEQLVKYGRHDRVGLLAVTRAPAEIHNRIRSEAWELCCFALQEPAHVEWLGKVVSPEFAVGIQTLPPTVYRRQSLVDRTQPWQELHTDPKFRSPGSPS